MNRSLNGVSPIKTTEVSHFEMSSPKPMKLDGKFNHASSSSPPTRDEAIMCNAHPSKKIEAYCVDDRKVLCIECILSDEHK